MFHSTRSFFQSLVLTLSAIVGCNPVAAFGQESPQPGVQELSRPADVLIAEVEGDDARYQLQMLLAQIRADRNECFRCETAVRQAEAGLTRRHDDKDAKTAKTDLELLHQAIDFAMAEVQKLGVRTDSSWLEPISQTRDGSPRSPLIELRVTIRSSTGDVIVPARIALRSAASAVPIRFENGVPNLAGTPPQARFAAIQDREVDEDEAAATVTQVAESDEVRVADADEPVPAKVERENAAESHKQEAAPPFVCLARPLLPGKYTLGWQLSNRSVVESCGVELKEPGLHLLEIAVKRKGGESTIEVKHQHRPTVPITKPPFAPSGHDTPLEPPTGKSAPLQDPFGPIDSPWQNRNRKKI